MTSAFRCMLISMLFTINLYAQDPLKVENMNPQLQAYIETAKQKQVDISAERKAVLNELANYISETKAKGDTVQLTFICTHNSRRSHMAQIWAAAAANYYGMADQIQCYSGGTEATAFNPRAVEAIRRAGFVVTAAEGDNPVYQVALAKKGFTISCFSKVYDHKTNPKKNFAAVMTCSDADKNCPFVPGAAYRVAIPYNDPKEADNTPEEAKRYDERSLQIASEMFYVISQVK